ncbi:hypothetical protein PIIN_06157 [Serendipita indica DSM 11827]|uniref:Uncharacterized protein n=1 Tax=Serendipita indica (strain DSM 11827) TaxID=1109443 RepID=G4TLM0_SERID|nr:hypothetical protein PIIN_06157 [Serendipita indica DSM 11827]
MKRISPLNKSHVPAKGRKKPSTRMKRRSAGKKETMNLRKSLRRDAQTNGRNSQPCHGGTFPKADTEPQLGDKEEVDAYEPEPTSHGSPRSEAQVEILLQYDCPMVDEMDFSSAGELEDWIDEPESEPVNNHDTVSLAFSRQTIAHWNANMRLPAHRDEIPIHERLARQNRIRLENELQVYHAELESVWDMFQVAVSGVTDRLEVLMLAYTFMRMLDSLPIA